MPETQHFDMRHRGHPAGNASASAYAWFDEVSRHLLSGETVEFSPQGLSMWPALRPATDTVLLRAAPAYRRSDIVLAACSRPRGIFLHRVARVLPGGYLLMGDSNLYQTELCSHEQIAGKIVGIRRGRRDVTGSPAQRALALIHRLPTALRRTCVRMLNLYMHKEP